MAEILIFVIKVIWDSSKIIEIYTINLTRIIIIIMKVKEKRVLDITIAISMIFINIFMIETKMNNSLINLEKDINKMICRSRNIKSKEQKEKN